MKNVLNALIFAVPVALLALSGAFCRGRQPEKAEQRDSKPAPSSDDRVKILQFYAAAAAVEPGGKTLLCYGVENAATVRIEPPIEPLRPALSRCFEVSPRRSTEYTLTAEAPGREPASASVTVEVKRGAAAAAAPPPAATAGPEILSFRLGEQRDGVTLLCYEVDGAEAVAVEPKALPRTTALRGCFGVAGPGVYTLAAYGANGKVVRRELTAP